MRETDLVKEIQVNASALGSRLFRNNCGSLQGPSGQWVRFGVANPGGSDLLGWTPTIITAAMVGKRIGIFTAVEGKTSSGRLSKEQRNFIEVARADGCIAIVARSVAEWQRGLSEQGPGF